MMQSGSGSPRIGLVGSCQVIGMGAALQKLWPGAEVKTWHLGPKCPDSRESIAEQLAGCDLAVSQVTETDADAPLAFARLRETATRAVFVPLFVFNGFQPDCVYLDLDKVLLVGPFVHLHSAIVSGGYVLGLPEAKVARLFNALTYAHLGYFEAFGFARHLASTSFAAHGYDVDSLLDRSAAAHGVFMHTMNHPNITVLAALAHMIAVKAGLAAPDSIPPQDVDDLLAHGMIWPVYPELARRLRLASGDLQVHMPSRLLERAPAHRRKITDVIGAFYKCYEQQDQAALRAAVPARVIAGLETALAS